MEAVKRINDNFLCCSICTQRFTDPCTLECGDTFCRECLARFTKSHQDAVKTKSILCPNCRKKTKVPNPRAPVEDWPKQFQPHFLIQGLLSEFTASGNFAPGSSAIPGKARFACKHKGKTTESGYICQDCDIVLCENCVKGHKNHTIVDVKGKEKMRGRRQVICKEHGSPAEFYCKKCNMHVCRKCGTVYHGKCNSVVTLKSVVEEMKSVVMQNEQSIQRSVEELQVKLALKLSLIEYMQQNKTSVQSDIKRVSKQAMDIIKEKERELMKELDKLTEKQTEQLREEIQTAEFDLHMYQQYCKFIDQALTSESQTDLCDAYRMLQSGEVIRSMDKSTGLSVRSSTAEITFTITLHPESFRENVDLGKLELSHDKRNPTRTPTLQETIDIASDSDKMDPSPFDVAVLSVQGAETVVVTDNKNMCLKSFCKTENQNRNSILRLNSNPRTVTNLTDNRVIVSFNNKNELALVRVTPDLVPLSIIKTQKEYRCLTALTQHTLAGGSKNPPSIDIIDISGKTVRTVATQSDQNLVCNPWFMCTTNLGHILVSDAGSMSVLCLTLEGDVVFKYRPVGGSMKEPRGITTAPTGDILIVDHLNAKVIELNERGEHKRDILTSEDGLEMMYGICCHGNKLHLLDYHQGTVNIYQFE